jgi:hypothetical protein
MVGLPAAWLAVPGFKEWVDSKIHPAPVYQTKWSEEKSAQCIVFMHEPSDFPGAGHCTVPELEDEITSLIDYHCEGEGCGYAYNPTTPDPAKRYTPDANVSADKKSIQWRRRYTSGAVIKETYTFNYRVPIKVCVLHCVAQS